MKHRTKQRAVTIVVAALAAAFAAAAAAQSTETPREGGVYQFGDANRPNGATNGQTPHGPDDRRQSGYPQPGTAAGTGAHGAAGMEDATMQPAPNSAGAGHSTAPGK